MIKFLSEFGPLAAFFIGYKYAGIQGATLYMLITAVISIGLCYAVERKVQNFSLVSGGILLISGSVTLLTGNSMFIKIKPTILYTIFGSSFLLSALKGKPFIKYLLKAAIPLREECWNILSYRCAVFFFVMAVANEFIWRNYDEATWVTFKVFGALPITMIFILLHIPFLLKNKLPE